MSNIVPGGGSMNRAEVGKLFAVVVYRLMCQGNNNTSTWPLWGPNGIKQFETDLFDS